MYTYQEPGWLVGEETTETTGGVSTTRTYVYDYDAAGNRERRWEDGVAGAEHVNAPGNVLTSVGGFAVMWDGLGGMKEDHRGYEWERYPDGSERALWDGVTAAHVVTRDAYGRPVEVDDGSSPSPYLTVWGNPGGEWPR